MSRRILLLLLVLMTAILLAGYSYLRVLAERVFFEAPPQSEQAARTRLSEQALQHGVETTQLITLYFPAHDRFMLAPEVRDMAWAETDTDRIRQVLLALVEGSQKGYGRALPSGTTFRAVFLTSDGTVFLDFSNDILAGQPPGIESETLVVYSIVNSLAQNIPSVKRVRILIQGQEVETLSGHTDLTEALLPDPSRVASYP